MLHAARVLSGGDNDKAVTEGKPCTRCMLEQAGREDVAALVKRHITRIPKENRTDDSEYSRRLAVCLSCDELIAGTCLKCGCFVELRAVDKHNACPRGKWHSPKD